MGKLKSFTSFLSIRIGGLFTFYSNLQAEWGYSSKTDKYLPEIREKNGFSSLVIFYTVNYLNNREALHLIFREMLFWQAEGLEG